MAAGTYGAYAVTLRHQRVSCEQQRQQTRQDIAAFRERMNRLADSLTTLLEGRDVEITLREMVPVASAGAYTIPGIALRCGRNWAGFTPQALYRVKGGVQLKEEVCLVIDNPGRLPRREKYMLCTPVHLLTAADWAIHSDGGAHGEWKVLNRELLLATIAPLFDNAE